MSIVSLIDTDLDAQSLKVVLVMHTVAFTDFEPHKQDTSGSFGSCMDIAIINNTQQCTCLYGIQITKIYSIIEEHRLGFMLINIFHK